MELEYNIKTTADLSGVQKATDALEKQDKVAGTLKEDLAGLSKQTSAAGVSSEETGKTIGKAGESAEMSSRSFRRLAHAMGSEIPGGAALMEAGFEGATSSMMGATFLLLGGIEMLKSAIQEINKEQEESKKISEALADADGEQTKAIENQREAIEREEVAEEAFYHNYIRNTQNAIDEAERLAAAILKTTGSVEDSKASKNHEIAAQEIEDMEKRGVVSHAAALKMKEQLDIAYEEQRMMRMIATDMLEEQSIAKQLAAKQAAIKKLGQVETTAETQLETATKAKVGNDTKIEEAKGKIATGEETLKALRDKGVDDTTVEALREWTRKRGGDDNASLPDQFNAAANENLKNIAMFGPIAAKFLPAGKLVSGFGSSGDVNLANYEGAQLDITAGKSDLKRAQGNQAGVDTAEENAKSDLEAARRELEKNRDQVRELQDKITELQTTNDIKERGANADLGMSKANASLIADRATADTVTGGGQASAGDAQKLIQDASRIAGHQVDLSTAAKIIKNGANNMDIFMNQIGILANALSQFSPAQMASLQKQVDDLKQKVSQTHHTIDLIQ